MITIVGVGHVFDIKAAVRDVILDRRPDVVCVELDKERYRALVEKRDGKGQGSGNMPFMYRMLSSVQERIAGQSDGLPGDEMIAAVEAARELGAGVAFIDMEVAAVGSILSKLTVRQRVKMMMALFYGLVAGKGHIKKELDRFEGNREAYLKEFESEFPELKKALIDDRDRFMAKAIAQVNTKYANIVAVIGDGHIEGIGKFLEHSAPDVVRLKQLMDGSWRRGSNRTMSFSFGFDRPQ